MILAPALATDPLHASVLVSSRTQLLYFSTGQSDISKETWLLFFAEYFPIPFSECCDKQQKKGLGLAIFFLLPRIIFQICSMR